jgi:RNA polymerase sigma-70 factor (ECF subfamily)
MADDHELLVGLRARRPEAFRELFDLYSDRMFRLAAGMLGSDDEAEDVVQEAFLRFFENLDSFEGRSQVGTWLYRTAHNASVDRLRRRRPTLALMDDEEEGDEDSLPIPALLVDWTNAPEELLTGAEAQMQLRRAIAALPETLRATFLLRDIEGFSTWETAEVLNISVSAAKVRLHRARLQLREYLSEYFSERLPVN